MRIWFIHPKYYDKKGILAQWNEGLICKNIIYGHRHELTLNKPDGLEKTRELPKKFGWQNHPFTKRATRYKIYNQKYFINHYLNFLSSYGINNYKIKFNVNYLEILQEYHEHQNAKKFPILIEHIHADFQSALDKMSVRDSAIFQYLQTISINEFIELNEPYYLTHNFQEYYDSLDPYYIEQCGNSIHKLIGAEINLKEKEIAQKYSFQYI